MNDPIVLARVRRRAIVRGLVLCARDLLIVITIFGFLALALIAPGGL